eukprot:jgi/Mesvir1/3480/Mv11971-RA.1
MLARKTDKETGKPVKTVTDRDRVNCARSKGRLYGTLEGRHGRNEALPPKALGCKSTTDRAPTTFAILDICHLSSCADGLPKLWSDCCCTGGGGINVPTSACAINKPISRAQRCRDSHVGGTSSGKMTSCVYRNICCDVQAHPRDVAGSIHCRQGEARAARLSPGRQAWLGNQKGILLGCRSSISHFPLRAAAEPRPAKDGRKSATTAQLPFLSWLKPPAAPASDAEEEEDFVPGHEPDVLIELRDVHKSFGSKKILAGANLKIRIGEAVGIIGPSGTGKSTILKIMAGLLVPDKGEVIICGKRRKGLLTDEDKERLRVGMVFQSASLFDSLTVEENVGFMLYEHSDLGDKRIRELVSASLRRVGLPGVEDVYPAVLSGGMKKRVALARAIISDDSADQHVHEVVMYDEPTAGLDPVASTAVEDVIRAVATDNVSSYIVVTHQHSTIRRAVDRLVFLFQGKVVWEGPVAEFDTTDEPIVRQVCHVSFRAWKALAWNVTGAGNSSDKAHRGHRGTPGLHPTSLARTRNYDYGITLLMDFTAAYEHAAEVEPEDDSRFEDGSMRESKVFLVDASTRMTLVDDDEKSFVQEAIDCLIKNIRLSCISNETDCISVLFYNTSNSDDKTFANTRLFLKLEEPHAGMIKALQGLLKESEFEDSIGSLGADKSSAKSLMEAIHRAQRMLRGTSKNPKAQTRLCRIYVLSCDDSPAKDDSEAKLCKQRIADVREDKVYVDLLPLHRPGQSFDVNKFYKEALSLTDEDAEVFMEEAEQLGQSLTEALRRKTIRKRRTGSVPLRIGDGVPLTLSVYSLLAPLGLSKALQLDQDTMQELEMDVSFTCRDTSREISKNDLMRMVEDYKCVDGGLREPVVFTKEDADAVKTLGEPGLRMLGFKPLVALKDHHNLRNSSFLYPDEVNKGSTAAFISLHTAMLEKKKFMLASFTAPRQLDLRLVALVAQEEVLDESGFQKLPPGMHVIYLPYSEDIRYPEKLTVTDEPLPPATPVVASEEQTQVAKEMVEAMMLRNFEYDAFENPELQQQYNVLETIALDLDDYPPMEDMTLPRLSKKATAAALAFKDYFYGEDYDERVAADKDSKAAKRAEAGEKRKAAQEAAVDAARDIDWAERVQEGTLNNLKVDELKTYCKANGLPSSRTKAALISIIENHMEKQGFTLDGSKT